MVQKLVGVRAAHAVQDLGFHVLPYIKRPADRDRDPDISVTLTAERSEGARE